MKTKTKDLENKSISLPKEIEYQAFKNYNKKMRHSLNRDVNEFWNFFYSPHRRTAENVEILLMKSVSQPKQREKYNQAKKLPTC